MSILAPSPKRSSPRLPIAPLSPKQNVLKKEMELNQAECSVLRNQNSQLEIETNSLRKQLKYIKKSINLETSQRSQLIMEEEKKLENKLNSLDEEYQSQVSSILNEKKQKITQKLNDLNSKKKEFLDSRQNIYSEITQSKNQLIEFMNSAHAQISKLIDLEKDSEEDKKLKELQKELEETYSSMMTSDPLEKLPAKPLCSIEHSLVFEMP